MNTTKFRLVNAIRLAPVSGQTDVTVTSTGCFSISNYKPRYYNERFVKLAETQRGKMKQSPCGLNRTIQITLPTGMATRREFHRHLDLLYLEYLKNEITLKG